MSTVIKNVDVRDRMRYYGGGGEEGKRGREEVKKREEGRQRQREYSGKLYNL